MNENLKKIITTIPTDVSGKWIASTDIDIIIAKVISICTDIVEKHPENPKEALSKLLK